MAKRTIIWDWNGTLFNDAWLCHDVMNWSLAKRDMPTMSFEHYLSIFTFPVIEYYRRVGFDFEREPFEVVGAEFIAEYERRRLEASLRDGVPELLGELQAAGWRQCILSAYQQQTLEDLTTHFGVRSFFDHVAGHDDIYASGKIAQGRRLVAALDDDPATMVLVGDTEHDAEIAAELGFACLLIEGGNQPAEVLKKTGAPVLANLAEVRAFLLN